MTEPPMRQTEARCGMEKDELVPLGALPVQE
jgi:hypothetical protein